MTREQFIDKACRWLVEHSYNSETSDSITLTSVFSDGPLTKAFRKAMDVKESLTTVRNNLWHKASEELPEVPEKKKYIKVLTTLPHGSGYDFRILYFHKGFGFSKHKEYQNVYYKDKKTGCVHWMYIPEIEEEKK